MSKFLQQAWGWAKDTMSPRRPSWRSASVVGMVIALAVAAVIVDGYRSAKFELDEASVWATNAGRAVAGRVNTLAGQVEVASKAVGKDVDVLQRGREVLVLDPGKSVTALDPATGNPAGDSIELTKDLGVASGGGRVAFFSSKSGRLWVTKFGDLGRLDLKKRRGSVKVPNDTTVSIGPTGTTYAISPGTKAVRYVTGPKGEVGSTKLIVPTDQGPLEANVVDTTPVVLSTGSGKLQVGSRAVDVSRFGASPHLQDGPATGSSVLVATETSLVSVPLTEGEPKVMQEVSVGGAIRPVRAGRCAYGAWVGAAGAAEPPMLVRACGSSIVTKRIDTAPGARTRFRVNGTYVILNQLDDGRSFLLRDTTLVVIDNWADMEDEVPTEQENPDQAADGGDNECDPKAQNTPPAPEADTDLGARPGTATVLDVLGNDRDADCDVLAIVEVKDVAPADAATIVPVDRGHSLQFTARPDFSGPVTFRYSVSDGRSAPVESSAKVTVKAFEAGNEPPAQIRPAKISVGPAQTVSFNVLESFRDPDGDAVHLEGADLPAGALGTVRAEPNGTVTFVDAGSTGKFEIALRVSDGNAGGLGKLDVEMVPDPAPIARNDHALGLVGQPVTIEVLANDTGVGGQELTLTKAESTEPDTTVQTDTTAGLVVFTATRPGSFRVPYSIASGTKEASAFVRVDISEPIANVPPVAVRDTATVVVGGTTMVDLVANDFDANLDVLVVSSVTVPPGTGLTVQLLEHRALRISASRLPDTQPVVIAYQVTDGQSDPVSGQLQLQVVTTGRVNQPPTARDDIAVVRAGDVVTVPVLANDLDPDGDPLTVTPKVTVNLADGAAAPGVAFSTTNAVRFVAGSEPGSFTIGYEVTDQISGTASALVRIRIVPNDSNQAPVPRSIEARTLVDGGVRINIPTFGVDPDGDAVTLALETPPSLGTVALGEDCDCFDYTPSKGKAGNDLFTYTATDPGGLSGTATVRVGIGLRAAANQPPIAVADKVRIRPGSSFAVPVLANDSDPDNDPIELVDAPIATVDGVSAKVVGDRVVVEASDPGTATLTYQVTDNKEATPGTVTVVVDQKAPPIAPVARDDVAAVPKDRGTAVPVDVLANDEDQDGNINDLKIEVDPLGAKIAKVDGRKVVVELGDRPAVVPYKITDADGLSGMAVIRVPAATVNLPPKLRGDLKAQQVEGGQTVTIKLADVAIDPEDANVLLVPGDNLRGDHGTVAATGPDSLSFTADQDYTGPGSVTFTATDGADPTDPKGARASLTVPIEIHSTKNTPPTLTGAAATVEVSGDPTTIDLRKFAADPDPGELEKLSFDGLTGMANGVTGSLSGSTLELSADGTAQKNTQQTLNLTVSDGKNDPVPATVVVSVVASRKPLATVVDREEIVPSGLETEIKVLEGSREPDGLGPLKVVAAQLDSGLGSAEVRGDSVVVKPNESFFGVGTVTFTVNDKLDDPDRRVTGKVKVTVKDRPGKPQAPTVAEYGHEFVVLTWQPPEARGGTIDKYELKSADGTVTKECTSTTCRLTSADNIKNDTTYTFTVRAHNEVDAKNGGWSEPSDPSKTVRPDTRPNPATVGPTLKYEPSLNSGELEISWPAADKTGPWINLGSAIIAYEVQLSPAPPNTAQLTVGPTTTSITITGLTDGQEYQAKVRAKNSANKEVDPNAGWSEFSPFGNKESPATESTPPIAVTAKRQDSPIASVIDVGWSRPTKINAKEMLGYTIVVFKNGAESARIPATQSPSLATFSQPIPADDSLGVDFTFKVLGTNKAGPSPLSDPSKVVRSFQKPKPITGLQAAETKQNGEVQLTFTPPDSSGQAITDYRVTASPGGTSFKAYSGSGILMSGLSNGTQYTFSVQACNQGQSRVDYCGNPSNAASANPYGPPGAPSVGSGRASDTSIQLSWSAPGPNGRPIDRVEISVDGGSFQQVGLSGNTVVGNGYQQDHCIVARAVSSGLTGPNSGQSCARTADPPIQVTKGQGAGNPNDSGTCPAGKCSIVWGYLRNFAPNSGHWVNCKVSGLVGAGVLNNKWIVVNGSGNADVNTGCYAGKTTVGIVVDDLTYDEGPVDWRR